MTYPARPATHLKLFIVAVLAFTLINPEPSQASSERVYRAISVFAVLAIVGSTLWYSQTSSSVGSDLDNQEHTLQLPVITYKKEAALKNHHSVDVRLAPSIDPKSKILEFKGTRSQLKGSTEIAICDPITEVRGVNKTVLKDIHDQCHAWFSRNRMTFPHEISGFDLAEAFNVVLPELVYRANVLTLSPYQVSLNPKHKKLVEEDMSYFNVAMSGFEPNGYFKTCYHYPRNAGMNPPMMDSNGELVFKLPKQGVTHLHHDGHAEYFIATHPSGNRSNVAFAWKLGSPWPPLPIPVRLTSASGEVLPVHVLDHE